MCPGLDLGENNREAGNVRVLFVDRNINSNSHFTGTTKIAGPRVA